MSVDNSTVEYRDIPGFPGYRVGDDGSVWSCLRPRGGIRKVTSIWRQMKPCASNIGYLQIGLRPINGKKRLLLVHRIVLEAFVGACPEGMQCCHNDGSRTNNRLDNLRWDTSKANHADCIRHGTTLQGERNSQVKLTAELVIAIRAEYAENKISQRHLARKYRISHTNIGYIVRRKAWRHID